MKKLNLTFAAIGTMGLLGLGTQSSAQTVYAPNEVDNNVQVIDLPSNGTITTIPVGVNPIAAAVSPDFKKVYVTNGYPGSGGNSVSVINTATNAVIATIPVGSSPGGVVVTPDNTKAYVTNGNFR
jgi:YVTN family beta-propeller protein